MVVAVGLTICVPPVASKVYELPLLPVTVTVVAFAAATVKVDELPVVIEVGFAVMVIVGAGIGVTVTLALADEFPPAPVALAVYVDVAVGLTCCVPPLDDIVYKLPSVPVTITCVAFVAATVKVDELPSVIDSGLAEIVIVEAGTDVTVTVVLADAFPLVPVEATV